VPKGWRVFCHTGGGVLRYNADTWDPSRWLGEGGGGGGDGGGGGCPMAAAAAAAAARDADADGAGGAPFGAGARACVGRPLVMAQMTALLALLARRYTWRWDAGAAGAAEPWAVVPAPRPRDGLAGFVFARAPPSEQIPLELGVAAASAEAARL
jgi:cytochrome P450